MKAIKCLSVQQPWAWLLVTGQKDVENRTWATPYRGPLLIHAGKKFDWEALCWLKRLDWDICEAVLDHFEIADVEFNHYNEFLGKRKLRAGEFGGFVGVATLSNIDSSKSRWAILYQNHWWMSNAKELPFIPCRGQLGLYNVPVEGALEKALGEVGL